MIDRQMHLWVAWLLIGSQFTFHFSIHSSKPEAMFNTEIIGGNTNLMESEETGSGHVMMYAGP